MKRVSVSLAALALFATLVGVKPSAAQDFGSAAAAGPQGFNSQILVFELSLFLPQEALGKAFGAGGHGGSGRSGSGAAAGGGAGAQQGQAGNSQRTTPRFVRDPKLFLTKDQVDRLLPILKALKDNPMPSPSKARQIEVDIDTIITKSQKTEYGDWRKEMAKFRQELRQRFAASGGQNGSAQGGGAPGGGAPGGAGEGSPGQAGSRGPADGSAPRMNELERRQRLLESFIGALQDYRQGL